MSIAVIIPTYQSGTYLAETLNSISLQERQPDEVLVVDDSSTDDTLDIAHAWAERQPFETKVIGNRFQPDELNGPGPAGGRMTGLLRAQSEMIALLDHDDVMLPNHLRLTEQALTRYPNLELCFGDAIEFDDATTREWSLFAGKGIETVSYHEEESGALRIIAEALLPSLVAGSYIPTAANLWRRETAIQIGGFSQSAGTCDDALFFLCLSRQGNVGYYPFPLARKRVHSGNLSDGAYALRHCWNQLDILKHLMDEPTRWKLTKFEQHLIKQQMQTARQEILYHASRQGLGAYLGTKKRMGRANKNDLLVGAVRAMVRSTRLIFDKTGA